MARRLRKLSGIDFDDIVEKVRQERAEGKPVSSDEALSADFNHLAMKKGQPKNPLKLPKPKKIKLIRRIAVKNGG